MKLRIDASLSENLVRVRLVDHTGITHCILGMAPFAYLEEVKYLCKEYEGAPWDNREVSKFKISMHRLKDSVIKRGGVWNPGETEIREEEKMIDIEFNEFYPGSDKLEISVVVYGPSLSSYYIGATPRFAKSDAQKILNNIFSRSCTLYDIERAKRCISELNQSIGKDMTKSIWDGRRSPSNGDNHVDIVAYALNDLDIMKKGVNNMTYEPKKVIYSGDRTVVIWKDDSKTVVKCGEGENFDQYTGFCAAFVKKLMGSTSHAKKVLNKIKVVPVEKKEER